MRTMNTVNQVIKQIMEENAYMIFHERKGHAIKEHVTSTESLTKRLLSKRPPANGNIKMETMFYSHEDALRFIQETVKRNISKINDWIQRDTEPFLELFENFNEVTGEGIAWFTNWNKIFKVHGMTVLLHRDKYNMFYVKTAYPTHGYDDVDDIYDAMEEYSSR